MTDTLLLSSLIALSVGLAVWAVANMTVRIAGGDRRTLKRRLHASNRTGADADRAEEAQRAVRVGREHKGLVGLLLKRKTFREIDALVQLSFPELGLGRFLGAAAGLAATLLMLVLAVTMNPIVAGVSAALGGLAPLLYLAKRKIKRQRLLDDQLPDAMDFLGRALKAGHSLSSGLQMMGTELPQPIAGEFRHASDDHSVGVPLDACLKGMTRRIDSTDFSFFVTAVLIQRQTGGDLSEVLRNISGMIRQRVRLQQQVKAKTAEGRLTGYLLTAFPAVIFVILYFLNREYASRLTDTTLGLKILASAFVMQVLGLLMIRKLTTVRV